MRAVVCSRYGPPEVLRLTDVPAPVPGPKEVLVRIKAATVMAGDCELRGLKGSPAWKAMLRVGFGLRGPRHKILGQDLAGVVDAFGEGATRFKEGDEVFGNTGLKLGAYAEFVCLPESGSLALKPRNLSFVEAATFPSAALYVIPILERAEVRYGQEVAIVGAGGTMGTLAVQVCKSKGAAVTVVDRAEKLAMLTSIGADRVVDYTKQDWTVGEMRYDMIFDVIGRSPFSKSMGSLKEGGLFIMSNLSIPRVIRGRMSSARGSKRAISGFVGYRTGDLDKLKGLVEAGTVRPVIDRRFPLDQIVEAHRFVESGMKAGNVVLDV